MFAHFYILHFCSFMLHCLFLLYLWRLILITNYDYSCCHVILGFRINPKRNSMFEKRVTLNWFFFFWKEFKMIYSPKPRGVFDQSALWLSESVSLQAHTILRWQGCTWWILVLLLTKRDAQNRFMHHSLWIIKNKNSTAKSFWTPGHHAYTVYTICFLNIPFL